MAFTVKPEAALASCFRNILQDMHPIYNSNDLLSFWGIDRDLKTLEKRLKRIQDVLNDAEWRSQTEESVSDWMDDLRELIYCIEDFVDDMNIERVRIEKQLAAKNQAAYTAQNQLAALNQAIRSPEYASPQQLEAQNYHSLDHQATSLYTLGDIMADCTSQKKIISESIKKIIGSLEEVVKDATELNLKPQTLAGTPVASFPVKNGEDIGPSVVESEIYGRQEDKDHVIELLMSPNDSSRNYSVVSIVGMGGVGKTTLARLVFTDERVKSNFDMQSWACVSDDFDFSRVVRELIEYISEGKTSKMTTAALLKSLKGMVTAKKVLFVLDDMWTVEAWEKLKGAFTHCAEGSKILVTTRNKNIGHTINDKEIYELQTLEDNYCWVLFKEKAFGRVVDETLERIGTKIVKKCKGVPLAVKVIGSSLRSAPKEMWESTLKNKIWESIDVAKDGILRVLKLSYYYLPSSLKRCFQYFAVFPTDYRFERDNLVRLWIAEGLIECREGRMLEDIGCSYYIELQRRCIIQEDGRMHDLLHGLACLVSDNFFSHSAKGSKSDTHMRSIRHLSLIDKEVNIEMFHKATCLRTLLALGEHLLDVNKLKWTLLRVLDLSGNDLLELPSSVGNLKHLRYFDLSWNSELQSLPDSICELHNLQTLDLSGCYGMRGSALPTHMGNLQNLRFLSLRKMENLSTLPSSIVKLSNLLTLDLNSCQSLTCMPANIGGLQSLQRLWLNGTSIFSINSNFIGKLQKLHLLYLSGCHSISHLPSEIGNLQHLRVLRLGGSSISCLPESICNIRNLRVLDISGCKSLNSLPRNIGNLQHLRELQLHWSSISCLPESICNIRNLQVLDISFCRSLKSLPPNIGNLTCIQKLERFEVGREEGHGIEELKDMNKLQGELVISCLANLQSVEHALMANLKKKVLDEIHFEWDNEGHESHDSINDLEDVSDVVDRELEARVLDALEPHPTSLKSLSFLNYRGGRIPKWLSALSFPVLKKLVMKGLEGINRMVDLELPSLEQLEIKSCRKLKDVSMGVPNLIILVVLACRDLTTLSISPSLGNSSSSLASSILDLPQLKELTFRGCSSLRDICMVQVPGLEKLQINDCKELKMIYVDHMPNLRTLMLRSLPNLTLLGGFHPGSSSSLASLKELPISSGCEHELISLAMPFDCEAHGSDDLLLPVEGGGMFPNLEDLDVQECPKLKFSPEVLLHFTSLVSFNFSGDQLEALKVASLQNLPRLGSMEMTGIAGELLPLVGDDEAGSTSSSLPTLTRLEIKKCPNLTHLPKALCTIASLRTLIIRDCPDLVSFPETGLPPLVRVLRVFSCKNLQYFPTGAGMLPILKYLDVQECPKLKFSLEGLRHFTSLESITFSGDQLEARIVASLENLPRLQTMEMTGIAGELLPLVGDDEAGSTSGSLPALTRLVIKKCPNLTHLPKALRTIASLQTLKIGNCPELVSFPETGLPPLLQELHVYSCKNLQYFPTGLNDHTSLRQIYFVNCERVEARPDDGPPPNFDSLEVFNCPKLEQQIKQHRKDWLPYMQFS